jgi:hypothetical protein
MPLWLKILVFAFFGRGAVMTAVVSLRGTTAVRVDEAGVTLCTSPLYPKSTTRLFPWQDVASVVIWQGPSSGRMNRLEYVGVEHRPGAPPITGKFTGRGSQSAARLDSPGIPLKVALTRAVTNGWVLDHGRLTAVAHFAPRSACSSRLPRGRRSRCCRGRTYRRVVQVPTCWSGRRG